MGSEQARWSVSKIDREECRRDYHLSMDRFEGNVGMPGRF